MAPSTPGDLTAIAAGAAQVDLSWSAGTDDVGVTGYQVLRDVRSLTTTGATSLDTAVTSGVSYRYTVKAVDAAGNVSAESVIAHVTTPGGTGGGQPTFRTASTADAAGPRVAIPTPEGTTEGDVLIAAIRQQSDGASVTASDGWSRIREDGKKARSTLFSKVAGASEPVGYDFEVAAKATSRATSCATTASTPPNRSSPPVWGPSAAAPRARRSPLPA